MKAMVGYRFRLQKVMKARENAEDRKKEDLAAALAVLEREEDRLRHLEAARDECRRRILQQKKDRLDLGREEAAWDHFCRLEEEIARQIEVVGHVRCRVDRERRELVERSRERKVLENLRERNLVQYIREWMKHEQKVCDGVGRDTFLRKSKNEERHAHDARRASE